MKYIVYECGLPGTLSGGFGDRLVGIVSTLSICKATGSTFLIKWHDTNMSEYFDYEKYDYFKQNISGTVLNYVNHSSSELFEIFSTKNIDDLFNADIILFNTNQNITEALCTNILYKDIMGKYETCIKTIYESILNEYLKPKQNIIEEVRALLSVDIKTVGIQLRFGDYFMDNDKKQIGHNTHNTSLGKNIENIFPFINDIINTYSDYKIFITSDINIKPMLNYLSCPHNILYYDMLPTHIERSIDKNGIIKSFVDFIMLCNCHILFISYESNFGRCAGLMNQHNNIHCVFNYDSNFYIKIPTISELSSKTYIEFLY